jgi:hypothetical protein
MFRHIVADVRGWDNLDPYFAYLDSVKDHLPPNLHAFASDVARYELQGTKTLHDAWLETLSCANAYEEGSNAIQGSTLQLVLRQALGGRIRLTYGGVTGWVFRGFSDRWPDRAIDLLTHEISLESDGVYAHRIEFDRDVSLEIIFRTFFVEDMPS